MKTKGQIVQHWREQRGMNTRELAEAVGTSRQNIDNLEADEVDQPRYLPALARFMGYRSVEDLLALQDPPPQTAEELPAYIRRDSSEPGEYITNREREAASPIRGAHRLSDHRPIVPAKRVDWRDLVNEDELPQRFELQMQDDSMSGVIERGEWGVFARGPGIEPRVGKPVLLADKDGNFYIREYRVGRPGKWMAAALKGAHLPLDSEADGLRVVAVMIGTLWG